VELDPDVAVVGLAMAAGPVLEMERGRDLEVAVPEGAVKGSCQTYFVAAVGMGRRRRSFYRD